MKERESESVGTLIGLERELNRDGSWQKRGDPALTIFLEGPDAYQACILHSNSHHRPVDLRM